MSLKNIVFAGSYWRLYRMTGGVVLCFYEWTGVGHNLITQDSFTSFGESLQYIDSHQTFYPVIFTTSGVPYADIKNDEGVNQLSTLNKLDLFKFDENQSVSIG